MPLVSGFCFAPRNDDGCIIEGVSKITRIRVRCYGGLNDYLPPGRCQQCIHLSLLHPISLEVLISLMGIPDSEVDLIIVNGEPVDFSFVVKSGDRVALYPRFRSIEISPIRKRQEYY